MQKALTFVDTADLTLYKTLNMLRVCSLRVFCSTLLVVPDCFVRDDVKSASLVGLTVLHSVYDVGPFPLPSVHALAGGSYGLVESPGLVMVRSLLASSSWLVSV